MEFFIVKNRTNAIGIIVLLVISIISINLIIKSCDNIQTELITPNEDINGGLLIGNWLLEGQNYSFEFKSNGSGHYSYNGKILKEITWYVKNNNVHFSGKEGTATWEFLTYSRNRMHLLNRKNGNELILNRN